MGKMMDAIYSRMLNELVELEKIIIDREERGSKVVLDTPLFIIQISIDSQPKRLEMGYDDIFKHIENKAAGLRRELTEAGLLKPEVKD